MPSGKTKHSLFNVQIALKLSPSCEALRIQVIGHFHLYKSQITYPTPLVISHQAINNI